MKAAALILGTWISAFALGAEPIDLSTRRELFIDHFLIDRFEDAELRLHAPQRAGAAIRFDKPWEGAFAGYVTVLKDGETFRMYYRGLPVAGKDGSAIETTCLAESRDGIEWTKPSLRFFEVNGTLDNNVILHGHAPASHNFSPFIDTNPHCPPSERFKALGGTSPAGLVAFVSADGVRWKKLRDQPVITRGGFDSQNVSFWSPVEEIYVSYLRVTPAGIRSIARATSKNFLDWTEPVEMSYGDTPREQLYTNQTQPYFRAPHLYLGVAARFLPGRRVLTAEEAKAIQVDPRYFGDCSDAVLLTTRGGNRYDRTFMEAFIRPGLGLENWVSRTNYPACGLLPLNDRELALYVQKNYGQPSARLDRYVLRLDGFASVHASYRGGSMTTKLLKFSLSPGATSARLTLNFATSAAGGLRVEILDEAGQPVPGFGLAPADELIGDQIDRAVTWGGNAEIGKLAGKTIRLRFHMKDADIYSLMISVKKYE